MRTCSFLLKVFSIIYLMCIGLISKAQLPALFTDNLVSTNWNGIEGIIFDTTGQGYAWEKEGKVWIVDNNGTKLPVPLIDITEEVGDWRDHGLNGFCLDPDFRNNGYYYLYYTVDRHHLINFGTGAYSSTSNSYYTATIARITRYTANTATNFTTTISGSRHVLIGETKKTGIPVLHETHSGGMLIFSPDGSLIVTTGDGATPNTSDSGSVAVTYYLQALVDTIIRPKEDVGSYRSQMIDCLNGKILRIDASTGDGLPSNPWYDSSDARAPKSRVWALGLRNPFRMALRPGTGNTDPTAGDPGSLYVGDVGWQFWEDIQVSRTGKENFGWPIYQGFDFDPNYFGYRAYNMDAPNPLYGTGGCTQQYFSFHELITNPTLNGVVDFPNPCDVSQQIPDSFTFVHARPEVDYAHGNESRTGTWNGNNAATIDLDSSQSPVTGFRFGGYASVAGCWYTGDKMPFEFQNKFFAADYAAGWIYCMQFNSADSLEAITHFADSAGAVVWITQKSNDGCLYYINYPYELRKICYTGPVNNPPVARAQADTTYGVQPLTVNFTGSNSSDPEGHPLTYYWDFDDGSFSTAANPAHIFTAPPNVPTGFWVKLTVTDDTLQTHTDSVFISVNNTPPNVAITSFNNGDLYSMLQNTILLLQAAVSDSEHTAAQLFYSWQTILHHNQHLHPEQPDNNEITSTVITPNGCGIDSFYYEIKLTVTDAGGLSTTVKNFIYPNCTVDCNGILSGSAYTDSCGTCVGGNTGLSPCVQDCNNDWGGTAYVDSCSVCVGGNTGLSPCVLDCNNDWGGTAYIDSCSVCVGGNTGLSPCVQDCNNDWGGTAYVDSCSVCVGGNTGLSPCVLDCNNDWGGTAYIDTCGVCVGGNTGLLDCDTITSINQIEDISRVFKMYPNPNNGSELILELNQLYQPVKFDIVFYDIVGKEIFRKGDITSNVVKQPLYFIKSKGVYIVSVTAKNYFSERLKLVIN